MSLWLFGPCTRRTHRGGEENITSSLNEIPMEWMGNRSLVGGGGVTPPHPPLSTSQASGQILKDDVKGFSSTSDICFMIFHKAWSVVIFFFVDV